MSHSRFYLCDLQVHTPADVQQGYGDVGGREPNDDFAEILIDAHRAAGVEVLAVTDHNRIDWYPVLREAGNRAGMFVFPGLEFSVQGCHLLAVWDRTDEAYEFARRFLASLWKPPTKAFNANGEPSLVTKGGVLELANEATEHHALVFAPHCTSKGIGLFASKVCRNSSEVAQSGVVIGFDVIGNSAADVLTNPRTEFGDIPPRWFISGDTRSLDAVGKRALYLKLGQEPTLEGIRQAFLMPETRIRFPEPLRKEWGHVPDIRFIADPQPTWPRLTTIEIAGGFHDGLTVDFGPGLNATIGGKGTGKSTLIEILRYALEAGDPIEPEADGNRRHNFAANAEASIGFIDQEGDLYEVRRSGDGTAAILLRGGADTGVEVRRRITVRVFGQRELRALVERPELLREFVASQTAGEWPQVVEEEARVKGDLHGHDTELSSLERQLARMEDAESELADVRDRLKLAEEKGVAELIQASKNLAQKDRAVRKALQWPGAVGQAAEVFGEVLPAPQLPEHPDLPKEIGSALATLEAKVRAGVESITAAIAAAEKALEEAGAKWEQAYQSKRKHIDHELADAGITQPRELEDLQRKAGQLEDELRGLPEKRKRHKEVDQQRRDALQRLAAVRRQKSRMVEEAARSLSNAVGPRVRLSVGAMADKSELLSLLERAASGQQIRREQLQRLSRTAPMAVAEAIREGAPAVEKLGCTSGTAAKLTALSAGTVREIEESDTPDEIHVEIDLGAPGAEAWTDVTEVSPGQRATALLALALASGTEPLIIDQPEDDLDNRYIYEEVVKVLARVCEARQVIVATHNANIPILGDAEMILALDAAADRSHVLAAGGLEDPDVASRARQILEGGDEAFRARHRRYLAAR